MSEIIDIIARQIFDSRGFPTIEVDVITSLGTIGRAANGIIGRAAVPSGASTGKHEAIELRDNDASFYLGKGVLTACSNVEEEIGEILIGAEVKDQRYIDQLMIYADGTENKMRFGANAILGVSLACARAAAIEADLPLYRYIGGANTFLMPVPMMNVINGGMHADNKLDFQEFMIMPLGASSFTHAMQMGTEIFQHLKSLLKSKNLSTNVGDEGGFAPNLRSNDEAIELLLEAVVKAGYRAGKDIFLAIDAAVSDMYNEKDQLYHFEKSGLKSKSSHEMVEFWSNWANQYPIFSIEDGLAEDDWTGWQLLTSKLSDKIQLVGDDLFVTNSKRIRQGIDMKVANSVLIKVNQIGTLSETIDAVQLAQRNKYTTVMSHRSGETEDHIIADLAVGLSTGQIKTGSLSRSDRMSKYNQLLRIEEELGEQAEYYGKILLEK